MAYSIIDLSTIRDISEQLTYSDGRMKVVPASVFENTTPHERYFFGFKKAAYGFITEELVAYVQSLIAGRTALEIGAGNGELSTTLGIRATDNYQQSWPEIVERYNALKHPVVTYGANVENLEAAAAVAKYRPSVVVASWVTHKYEPSRHFAGGNSSGVVEEDIINACDTYIFIGNEDVHKYKSIWKTPHTKINPPWLYSRATNGTPNFIAIWNRPKPSVIELP